MKKGILFGAAILSMMAMKSGAFYGDDPEAEQKTKAIELIKTTSKALMIESMPDLLKAGLGTPEAEAILKSIVEGVVKGLDIQAEDFDGTTKSIKEIIKGLQTQHDKLVEAFEGEGGNASKKGEFIAYVEKTLTENKSIENDKTYNSRLTFKAAALMTTANVVTNVAGGFSPLFGNYIDTEIGHTPKPANVILPLITVKNQPGTESIWYTDRINEEGDAQFIAEGALKPLIDAEWKTYKVDVKEVAERWKMSKRLVNHAPSIVSDFYEHAKELIDQKVDTGTLSGTGVGNELQGLTVLAGAFIVPPQLAAYYERANIYDVINAMATRIMLSNFNGQITAVLNTVWKAKMLGIKDADGRYIMPDFVTPDGKKVSDVNVVFSNKISDADILIGELKRFNLVWAETVTYDEGYENDDFSRNLMSKKLEAFMGTYIKGSAAGSILFDQIASVLTDIAKPVV